MAAAAAETVIATVTASLSGVAVASAFHRQREGAGEGTVVLVESTEVTRDPSGTEGLPTQSERHRISSPFMKLDSAI